MSFDQAATAEETGQPEALPRETVAVVVAVALVVQPATAGLVVKAGIQPPRRTERAVVAVARTDRKSVV